VRHLQRWQKMLVQLIFALRGFVHLQQLSKSGMLLPRANDLLVQMLKEVRKFEAQQRKEFGAS
jgi:Tfp pilus assembly protein PilN